MIRFVLSLLSLFGTTCLLRAQPVAEEAKGHSDLIHTIAFSPDGKTFATGGFDKEIKIWDYANGEITEIKTLSGHTDPVYCVAYLPDGKRLASSSHDKTIRIWNLADGKVLQQLKGHTDIVDTIAVSPDGKLIASGSGGTADKSVRLWNPDDGKEVKNLGTHNGTVHSVAFSPDGKLLASGGADNIIKIWDVPGQKELMQLKGHELGVTGVVFVSDRMLVSISQDRTLRVWDLDAKDPTPKIVGAINIAVGSQVRQQMKSKKPIKDVFAEKPAVVKVETNAAGPDTVVLKGEQEGTSRIDFTDDAGNKESYTVVVKADAKDAKDVKKEVPKKEEPKKDAKEPMKKDEKDFHEIKKFGPTSDDLYSVSWSKETKAILTAGYAGNISLWDLNDPKPKFTKKLKLLAYCVTFSPDGKAALSGHLNGFIYVTPLK